MTKLLHGLCWLLLAISYGALALWVAGLPFLWILRDGLGPDSVTTSGWDAFRKFAPVVITGAALGVAIGLLHGAKWWLKRQLETAQANDQPPERRRSPATNPTSTP